MTESHTFMTNPVYPDAEDAYEADKRLMRKRYRWTWRIRLWLRGPDPDMP